MRGHLSKNSHAPPNGLLVTVPFMTSRWIINDLSSVNRNITPWIIVNGHRCGPSLSWHCCT